MHPVAKPPNEPRRCYKEGSLKRPKRGAFARICRLLLQVHQLPLFGVSGMFRSDKLMLLQGCPSAPPCKESGTESYSCLGEHPELLEGGLRALVTSAWASENAW